MLPSTLWQKELAEATANRKSLFIRFAFPIAIGGSFLMVAPPTHFTATVITLLAAITGCFGTGATLSRARSEGMLQRIALTPISHRRVVLEQMGINSLVDFCRILPLTAAIAVKFEVYDLRLAALLAALVATIAGANLLGLVMTLYSSSVGEVMLYSSLALFPLLYLGGVFSRLEVEAGPRTIIAAMVPFSYLQQALLAAMEAGESTWPTPLLGELSVASTIAVALIAAAIAPRVLKFEP